MTPSYCRHDNKCKCHNHSGKQCAALSFSIQRTMSRKWMAKYWIVLTLGFFSLCCICFFGQTIFSINKYSYIIFHCNKRNTKDCFLLNVIVSILLYVIGSESHFYIISIPRFCGHKTVINLLFTISVELLLSNK